MADGSVRSVGNHELGAMPRFLDPVLKERNDMSIDPLEYEREEAITELLDSELQRIAEEPVLAYLARHGDHIETRVQSCRDDARRLIEGGFGGAALVSACTAIEITIRYFLVRPLFQGAFLTEAWAEFVSGRVFRNRSGADRDLLPAILRNWEMDITSVSLPEGGQVWQRIVGEVWPKRNGYVHKGTAGEVADAELALRCLDALLNDVVAPVAQRLGFTRETTGRGCEIADRSGLGQTFIAQTYPGADPFCDE